MLDYVDKELSNYNKEYDKISRNTLDEFQNIFDIDKDLDEDATRSDLNRLQRAITNNYEYMSSYGQYEARRYLKKRRIKYKDWFWFYFFMIYSFQTWQIGKMENIIFKNVVADTYKKEVKELSKVLTPKKMDIDKLTQKLASNYNSKGYIWLDYKDAQTLYNTNELYNTYTLQKRSNKPLNVNNKTFKKLFDKQKHRLISIKDGKTSGSMDNMLIYLANETKIQTYIFNDVKKCRFIAIHDKKTTEMCRSLDGQIFNVHDWNKFRRYSGTMQNYQTYNIYGMVAGINLPPIDDNFHYCRSTIIYQLDKATEEDTRNKLTGKAEQ